MKKNIFFLLSITLLSCSKKETFKNNRHYEQGKICLKTNNSDSAFYYFNLAKNDYIKTNDSLGISKSLVNMGIIQSDNGDFYGAIETTLEANKFLKNDRDSTNRNTLASSYNCMAIASHFLKNYEDAFNYHLSALKYSNDSLNKRIYYNNIGDVLITLGKFNDAKKYLEKAIKTSNKNNYSRALNNLAKAKYLDDNNYNPLPEFYQALNIRKQENDGKGQNSSYETLSSYYLEKDKALSLKFANEMLTSAIKNESVDDQILALQKIIFLDPETYSINFERYLFINDSVQTARNKAKKQFAIVRYDVEQKNAQNQSLKDKNFKQAIGILFLALSLIIGIFWYKKRKKRLQQEKELEVKNTQLRLSKKVHDVVANGIYQVMTKIENQEHFDRDTALDELEFVYEKSRDISYDKADEEQEFSKKISELIASFNNDTVKTFTAGNNSALWENISPPVKDEVFQIIRELMVNMKKHSQASHVAFRFEKTETSVEIQYKDNGIGIPGDLIYKNGLRNAESRMAAIGGAIIFDTEIEKGLKVNLSVPTS